MTRSITWIPIGQLPWGVSLVLNESSPDEVPDYICSEAERFFNRDKYVFPALVFWHEVDTGLFGLVSKEHRRAWRVSNITRLRLELLEPAKGGGGLTLAVYQTCQPSYDPILTSEAYSAFQEEVYTFLLESLRPLFAGALETFRGWDA